MKQTLPLGQPSFTALRENKNIYVDKTDLIYQLAHLDSKIFLSRPRRFGKTLLVSTFESLFKDGLKYFSGLAIEKLWKDTTYPVVRLDFSWAKDFSYIESFKQQFDEILKVGFASVGIQFDTSEKSLSVIAQIASVLSALTGPKIVILIDEYDAPLTQCLDQPELFKEVQEVINRFFSVLKLNTGCFRFFFMTGVTKFSNTGIFSAFNNLEDISLDPLYGTILGYTEEELHHSFEDYICASAHHLNLTAGELMDRLREQYDGFCFDCWAKTHVYCPWSVLTFFKNPHLGFQNYWYETGGQPSVLLNYLKNHALASPAAYAQPIVCRLSGLKASRQYNDISVEALLVQAGYITIKALEGADYVRLGYPNQEVAVSMASLYSDCLLRNDQTAMMGIAHLERTLSERSLQEVVQVFNQVFACMDYQRYPVRDEASCRAYLQVLMIGAALLPRVEVHNAKGRSDLEVETRSRHWVFELKFVANDSQAPTRLDEAVAQMRERQYGQGHAAHKPLMRVALVFSAESRSFVVWREVSN